MRKKRSFDIDSQALAEFEKYYVLKNIDVSIAVLKKALKNKDNSNYNIANRNKLLYLQTRKYYNKILLIKNWFSWVIRLFLPSFITSYPSFKSNLKTLFTHPYFKPLRVVIVSWSLFVIVFSGILIYVANQEPPIYGLSGDGTDVVISNKPSVNGVVNKILTANDGSFYVAGNFNYIGYKKSNLALYNLSDNSWVSDFVYTDFTVYDVISDGSGGWYIGGEFDNVYDSNGAHSACGLAHIKSDKTFDTSFTIDSDSCADSILTLHLNGNILYIGGTFTSIGGQTRNYIAAIDVSTNSVTAWNPNITAGSEVDVIKTDTTYVYFGGNFSSVNSTSINNLARVLISDASLDSAWLPNPTNNIYDILIDGTDIFVAGDFGTIGENSVSLSSYAKLDTDGNADSAWNLGCSGYGRSIDSDTNYYYLGGASCSNGSLVRIAKSSTSIDSTWSPQPKDEWDSNSNVYALTTYNSNVYAGGNFVKIDNQNKNIYGIINSSADLISSTPDLPHSNFDDAVNGLAINSNYILVAGKFTYSGGISSPGVIHFTNNGNLDTSFRSQLTINVSWGDLVNDIALDNSNSLLYVAGSLNGSSEYIKSISSINGSLNSSWTSDCDSAIKAIDIYNNKLYVIGDYISSCNSTTRNEGANFIIGDPAGSTYGDLGTWNPDFDGSIVDLRDLVIDQNTGKAYIGGEFDTINSTSQSYVCAIDTNDGSTLYSWNPNLNGSVYKILLNSSDIYLGGNFTSVGGSTVNRLVKVDNNTGAVDSSFDVSVDNGIVYDLLINNSDLYVFGTFSSVDSTTRNGGAKLNLNNGDLTTWDPNFSTEVYSGNINSNGLLVVGGNFSLVNSNSDYAYLVQFNVSQPEVEFSQTSSSGSEKTSNPGIQIELNQTVGSSVTVNYTISGGTAASGDDFNPGTGSITIDAGQTTANLPITIVNDNDSESSETIIITLSSASGAVLGAQTTFTYTITDDDSVGLNVLPVSTTITEGESVGLDVSLKTEPSADVVVNLSADSQLNLSTNTLTFTNSNWNTAQTITITSIDDEEVEGDHSGILSFTLSSADVNYDSLVVSDYTINITDNDSNNGPVFINNQINKPSLETIIIDMTKNESNGLSETIDLSQSQTFDFSSEETIDNNLNSLPTINGDIIEAKLVPGTGFNFNVNNQTHSLIINNVNSQGQVEMTFYSEPLDLNLKAGEEKVLDLDKDGINDVYVKVNSIDSETGVVDSKVVNLHELLFVVNDNLSQTFNPVLNLRFNDINDKINQIAISESEDFSGLSYFSLTPGVGNLRYELKDKEPGLKTIYVKFRNKKGQTLKVKDSIELLANQQDSEQNNEEIDSEQTDNLDTGNKTDLIEQRKKQKLNYIPGENYINGWQCRLPVERAYKSVLSPAVYYITADCTKRVFPNAVTFFDYFDSWSDVNLVLQYDLDRIPDDKNYYMARQLKDGLKNGILLKSVSGNKVYLILENKKHWFTNEQSFVSLGYKWGWIKEVDSEYLNSIADGEDIDYIDHHPNYAVFKYFGSPRVYRLEPDPNNSEIQIKRWIKNVETFNKLNYAWEYIPTISALEEYLDGEPLDLSQ